MAQIAHRFRFRHRPDRRDGTDDQRCPLTARRFTGDGAYDRDAVYGEVAARHPDAAVVVPSRLSAVHSETAETAPTQRDQHLQVIAGHGNWRALVEADIGRWKRVIGHALRSQTNARQATEVAIAANVLNRMLELWNG